MKNWKLLATVGLLGLVASLVFAYFYLWLGTQAWPPAGIGVQAGEALVFGG